MAEPKLHDDALASQTGPARKPRPRPGRAARGALVWGFLAMLIRLAVIAFLLWGVLDTGRWLNATTAGLAPGDPAAIRYNIFAIYELARNATLGAAAWLLTMIRPRR